NPALAAGAELEPGELEAIRAAVPWTRPFRAGAITDAAGRRIDDAVEYIASQPNRFVLKRAWEYGGKAVFLGQAASEPSLAERSRAAYGEALDWPKLCRRAAEDPVGGGFVVQEFIPIASHNVLVCSPDGLQSADWYIDFSAYASVGVEPSPNWGGVCRGSCSEVVNIVGGGGVLPLIQRSIADERWRALVPAPGGHLAQKHFGRYTLDPLDEELSMDWNNPVQAVPSTGRADVLAADQARAFMARVYRWMFLGLGITGVVALYTASSPTILRAVIPMIWPLLIGELILVMALSWAAPRMTGALAATLFLLYSAFNGLTFSTLFLVYQLASIGQSFLLTAAAFGALSAYATFTKRDLSAWRAFLFIGLIGVV